jgi:hypothetical protein
VRRIATVGLALAAAGLLAAPPVAHVTGVTGTHPVVTRSAAQGVDVDDGQTSSAAPSSPRIIAPAGVFVFATESHFWDVLRGHATAGTALIVLDVPCPTDADRPAVYGLDAEGHQLATEAEAREEESSDVGPQGDDLVVDRRPWPPHDPGGSGKTTGPCALSLRAQMTIDDPATGWVTVGQVDDVTVTGEAGQLHPYRVARGSDWQTFLFMILVAAATGGFGVVRFVRSPLVNEASTADVGESWWRRWGRRKLIVPGDHPLRGSWVSSLAAVGAAATTLLAATGALSELAPQYQTGKVVIGNILVVTLLAIAAALISAGSHNNTVKLGYATAAVFAAVSAIAGQLLLTALVLLHASQHEPIRWITTAGALVTVVVLAWTVRRSAEGQPTEDRRDAVRTLELEPDERQRVEITLTIPGSDRPVPRT